MNLTPNELAIMKALWSAPRPLTLQEILATSQLHCKGRSIYMLLNSLIQKEMICVVGYIYSGKKSRRVFSATRSPVEYAAKIVSMVLPSDMYDEFIHHLDLKS